ncbi:hypothetical protein K492DRAFT_179897 [Lichtheimia hyalospora FSU 10163]|nr:hypothetical protein K492DRAFT_179897 [Lichtheimia hyalospora FSU 10163]
MTNACGDFSQQPIVTIESGTSTNVIADSTRCLQQCLQQQLSHLDNRARALATCAHFEAALRDATTMQQLNPSSAAGYLCAGHVCSLQGREKAAIEIYDKGLAVVPLSDPYYQQLLDARSMAQDKDSKCIDFIKEFPLDIIEHIAPRMLSAEEMAPSELEGYLGVSRVWREKLLLGIQALHIGSTMENDLGDNDDLLEQVAPYCTALTLYQDAIGFTRLISKAPFSSLHTLDLYGPCGDEKFNGTEIPKTTLASLPFLTHLSIRAYAYNLNLADILSACPHLVYLKAYGIEDDLPAAPECHPRLKTLLLWDHEAVVLDIHGITKRLPALEIFVVEPFYHSKDLKVVQDNCPNLKVIGCNDDRGWHGYVLTFITTTTENDDPNDIAGVHTLYIDQYDRNWIFDNVKNVMDFMTRNRHTLQEIYFWADLAYNDTENNDPSATPILDHPIHTARNDHHGARFTQMTSYTQHIYRQESLLMARWVARNSPHLTDMELEEGEADSDDFQVDTSALFDDLLGLCELDTVKISLDQDTSADMGGIERFIRYHSTFDSQLHTLTLPKNTRLSIDTLDVLASLSYLKNLSIHIPLVQEEDPDGKHLSQFIHKLAQGCPHLEHLEIRNDGPIHDSIFLRLSELHITSLKLEMDFYEKKLPMSLLCLMQCPQLQVLHIVSYIYRNDPHKDIRDMLKMLGSKQRSRLSLPMVNSCIDFSQEPIVTIASGTSTKVIADSTHGLQQCMRDQLSHLDNRARALATCAHFEAAMKDAMTMQQLNPCSATGYLCAGHVYSLQGREKAAIAMYDQGLVAVPSSDPSYQPLVDARSIAQEKDHKVIDFIKEFPVDIIENLAPKILSEEEMAPSELEECLGVSRVWREKLLFGVQELHIGSTMENDLGDNDDLLELVAPYCTALTLYQEALGFTQLIPKAPFSSLHTLVLFDLCDDHGLNATGKPKEALASLPSLTHLTIHTHYYKLTLGDILNSCPDLVYLKVYNLEKDLSTVPECHPRIKALLIYQDNEYDLHVITKRLPALELFVMNPFYHSKDLKVVQDNCPNLKVLGCNDSRYYSDYAPTTSSDQDSSDSIGVHTFAVDCHQSYQPNFAIKDMMDFMTQNRHTLQQTSLCISLRCSSINDNDVSGTDMLHHAVQNVSAGDSLFKQMTHYTQKIDRQDDVLMARWIARTSPCLKEMVLQKGYIITIDTGALFDDLIGLCELEILKIDVYHGRLMESIERFIQYHSTFDSKLHTLTLPTYTRLSMDALELLATLSRLENLSIHLPLVQGEDPDGEQVSQFIHKLAEGCPQLDCLTIRTYDRIHDNILLRLSELPITTLTLDMFSYKTKLPRSLLSLMQCPRLRHLHIIACNRGDDQFKDIRNMLNTKIEIVTGI